MPLDPATTMALEKLWADNKPERIPEADLASRSQRDTMCDQRRICCHHLRSDPELEARRWIYINRSSQPVFGKDYRDRLLKLVNQMKWAAIKIQFEEKSRH